ncbi:NYN domain-containing protein [Nocardioides mangrovicus]|uniref:NYN domain-containing protein n=1 Tax=Nocardioides mangrovicus TaxID=2478913 RepID=A0A3L8P5M3_9ACTN|nr:NYN domain-containing protein [Nocardioides mangrovicus]RLV50481.1 NYN domain-containing protein [Nocardioides mangrovicus]
MAGPQGSRVAVYLDFDNVVISRYDAVFGDGRWRKDDARHHGADASSAEETDRRLAEAEVDVGAILDYASSFGTVALTRAYADWSSPANAAYRGQLVDRAVDLVQLFATSGTKNGADIRLSVDAVDDLFQHDDLTHVVVVAGDSDYIPLAQRCKRLGRFVVGIGVTGATSRALIAACDEFSDYDALPGVVPPKKPEPAKKTPSRRTRKTNAQDDATNLLVRAIRVGLQNSDDEWLYSGGVKSQMQRMDSGFKEKALGFSSFRAFVESRADAVETRTIDNGQLQVRLV